jgi:hypothetical protein
LWRLSFAIVGEGNSIPTFAPGHNAHQAKSLVATRCRIKISNVTFSRFVAKFAPERNARSFVKPASAPVGIEGLNSTVADTKTGAVFFGS